MRHLAWLYAKPGKAKTSRKAEFEKKRTALYDPVELQLPDIYPCDHIAEYLFEVGPTTGEQSLSWQEIQAWRKETGVTLNEFEVTALVALSKSYLGMLHDARDDKCPPPYFVEKPAAVKAVIASRLREALHAAAAGRAERRD